MVYYCADAIVYLCLKETTSHWTSLTRRVYHWQSSDWVSMVFI